MEGDPESAEFFYEKAQSAGGANRTVGLATRQSAEGSKLSRVASESDAKVGTEVTQERDARRQHQEPILLRRRDNSVVQEPPPPPANAVPQQNPQ
jgi:hypothetical protein